MDDSINKKVLKPWPLGWKAKIGLLLPSQDDGYVPYQYSVLCPDGFVCLNTRVMGGFLTLDMMTRMRKDAVYAAKLVAVAKPDVISYEPTTAGFILGVEGNKELIREIENETGIKASTGASGLSESLRALNVKKMIMYAPTTEEITAKWSIKYFEDQGFEVTDHESLGLEDDTGVYRMSPWELYSRVMKIYKRSPKVDGILIVGSPFRTFEIIEMLERDSGLPVVTTITGNMYRCLQIIGINDPIYGFGRLLEMDRI